MVRGLSEWCDVLTLERSQSVGRIHRVLPETKEGAGAHHPSLQDRETFFTLQRAHQRILNSGHFCDETRCR